MRRYKPYSSSDGLRLAEERKWIWMEIGKFLGNLKWPEGKAPKEMQQFRQEATVYHVSDG